MLVEGCAPYSGVIAYFVYAYFFYRFLGDKLFELLVKCLTCFLDSDVFLAVHFNVIPSLAW
jgi:hypothetical protein